MYSRIVLRKINSHGILRFGNFERLALPIYLYITELPEIILHLLA